MSAADCLKEILRLVSVASPEALAGALSEYLEQDLLDGAYWRTQYAALALFDVEHYFLSEALHYENEAKILALSRNGNLPTLAHLLIDNEGRWRLRSFLGQCPACFGTGVLDETNLCAACGAKGWGAVNF